MKINYLIPFILLMLITNINADILQKTETDPVLGSKLIFQQGEAAAVLPPATRPENLWQTTDAAAICGQVIVANENQNSLARWQTNSERVSLFDSQGNFVWEHTVGDIDFDYPIAMTDDGNTIAIGDNSLLKILSPDSPDPLWSLQFSYNIKGIQLSEDGEDIYVSFYNEAQGFAYIQKYTNGEETPLWEVSYPGGCGSLVLSQNNNVLIFTQYGGENSNMFVFDTADGSLIFAADEYNQNSPAVSADGSIIVNGDYSGYIWVYQYQPELETYIELWHYHVNGGGTSDWIGGMAVSADASTIAVGTLTFITGGYNGQIYLFNSISPTPLWVYENVGDYVIDLDLTADGSLLAAASYGPYGAEGPEFLLFRRLSNDPVFEIDSPGSLFSVDIAPDGSFCTTGGKAVHAREMGSGGYVYCIDCDLGGGHIAGSVTLEGTDDYSGVRIEAIELTDYYTYTDSEGNYLLSYLPEGLHTLEFSKIGYSTYTSFDGVVIAGETTELEGVTLSPLGAAPRELTASQAAGEFITLNWQNPEGEEPAGYYIYRKRYQPDPYPEEPYAIVFTENTYLDEEALPRTEYYYAVTAMTDGGEQSPLSNEAVGWTSSAFMVDHLSVYSAEEPIIDGIIDIGEWDDAYMFDASDFWGVYDNTAQPVGSVMAYLKTDPQQNYLYAAFINYNDPTLEDHDEVALYIDDNADGVFPATDILTEGNYWAVYYAAGNELKYRPIYNTGSVGTVIYLDNPQVAASDAAGYVVFEFAIPFGEEYWEIDPSEDNTSTIGIFMLDDNSPEVNDFDSWWPHSNLDLFDPAAYGLISYLVEPQQPSPPQNLIISQLADNSIELNWTMPAMNDFDHFNIYFALEDGPFEIIDTSTGTCWIHDYDFYPQSHYSYYLTTVNHSNVESDGSNIVEYFSTSQSIDEITHINCLAGNYPNPFNPTTTFRFSLATAQHASLSIYNIKGQKVAVLLDEMLSEGWHEINWNGKSEKGNLSSGIYFYQLKTDDYNSVNKMLMLK